MPRLTYWPSLQLAGGPGGQLVPGESHCSALLSGARPGRTVRFSIRLSAAAPASHDTRWTNTPGRCTSSGSISPGSTRLLDLGDGDPAGHRGQRVEVARGLVEDEVAVPVAAAGAHQREVRRDRLLQHALAAAERRGPPSAGDATATAPSAS